MSKKSTKEQRNTGKREQNQDIESSQASSSTHEHQHQENKTGKKNRHSHHGHKSKTSKRRSSKPDYYEKLEDSVEKAKEEITLSFSYKANDRLINLLQKHLQKIPTREKGRDYRKWAFWYSKILNYIGVTSENGGYLRKAEKFYKDAVEYAEIAQPRNKLSEPDDSIKLGADLELTSSTGSLSEKVKSKKSKKKSLNKSLNSSNVEYVFWLELVKTNYISIRVKYFPFEVSIDEAKNDCDSNIIYNDFADEEINLEAGAVRVALTYHLAIARLYFERGEFTKSLNKYRAILDKILNQYLNGKKYPIVSRNKNGNEIIINLNEKHLEDINNFEEQVAQWPFSLFNNIVAVLTDYAYVLGYLQPDEDVLKDALIKNFKLIVETRYKQKKAHYYHRDLVLYYYSLGIYELNRNNFTQAKESLMKALDYADKIYTNPNHPMTAKVKHYLAKLFYLLRDYRLAETLVRESLSANRVTFGPDHIFVASNLSMLGNIQYARGMITSARNHYDEALTICKRSYGEGSLNIRMLFNMEGLAKCYYRLNDFDRAISLLSNIIMMYQSTTLSEKYIYEIKLRRAKILAKSGKLELAKQEFQNLMGQVKSDDAKIKVAYKFGRSQEKNALEALLVSEAHYRRACEIASESASTSVYGMKAEARLNFFKNTGKNGKDTVKKCLYKYVTTDYEYAIMALLLAYYKIPSCKGNTSIILNNQGRVRMRPEHGKVSERFQRCIDHLNDNEWCSFATTDDYNLSIDSFYAIAFLNQNRKELTFSFRGTESSISKIISDLNPMRPLDFKGDIRADIQLASGTAATQVHTAQRFINEIKSALDIEDGKSDYRITFTGHSLGAMIAEAILALELAKNNTYGHSSTPNTYSVTFESPGTKDLICEITNLEESTLKTFFSSHRFKTFSGFPNLINTLKRQTDNPLFIPVQSIVSRFEPQAKAILGVYKTNKHMRIISTVKGYSKFMRRTKSISDLKSNEQQNIRISRNNDSAIDKISLFKEVFKVHRLLLKHDSEAMLFCFMIAQMIPDYNVDAMKRQINGLPGSHARVVHWPTGPTQLSVYSKIEKSSRFNLDTMSFETNSFNNFHLRCNAHFIVDNSYNNTLKIDIYAIDYDFWVNVKDVIIKIKKQKHNLTSNLNISDQDHEHHLYFLLSECSAIQTSKGIEITVPLYCYPDNFRRFLTTNESEKFIDSVCAKPDLLSDFCKDDEASIETTSVAPTSSNC